MHHVLNRALLGIVFFAAALSALAQPVAWQHTLESTTFPKITRDPSGNLYVATRTASFGARQLRMQKINPLGTVIWSTVVAQATGDIDIQYNIRRMIYAHNSVYVLYQERAGGGYGSFSFAYARKVDPATGASSVVFSSASVAVEAIVGYSTGLVYAAYDGGEARLFRTGVNGGVLSNVSVAGFSRVDDVACQPDGTAFLAASRPNGTVSILKVNPDDSTAAFDFDVASRTGEQMSQVRLDSTANRLYGFGAGYYNGIPTDLDVTFYAINTDGTGSNQTAAGSSGMEYPGELTVTPSNGIVVSYFSEGTNPDSTIARKLTSTLTQTWTSTIYEAQSGYGRSNAFDADGNLLVLDTASSNSKNYARITKKSIVTGETLLTTLHEMSSLTTLELLSDAAGNYYCTVNAGSNAYLFRLQPAILSYSANTIPGGGTITATITLAHAALGDQTWTLASANPTAATVPANATVPNGATSATFDITTQPVVANTNVGISARFQGFIMQKTLTLVTPTVSALSITPNVVIGGVNTAGLVTIGGTAPAGGKTVNLASSNTAAATVPASVVVPAGTTQFGFGITTYGVTANRGVVITATTGAISRTAFFAVNAPSLVSVGMNPSTVKGGLQTAMTVTLDGVAPTGGRSVVIFSGAPGIVFAPATVTVPAGVLYVTQNLNTAAVTSTTNVLIFATRSGIYKTTTLTVTP